jgi:ribosomal protein S18 acetylase RimI-like enzyme
VKIRVRQARKDDKDDVMSFVSKTWGGSDYIPKVWDKWIKDRNGRIHVIELEGKIVGMNRISFLPDGYCWLQGARIHPEYRGKGLATILGLYVIKWAEGLGFKKFRLSCSVRNYPAIAQVSKMGFKEMKRISVYSFKGRPGSRCVELKKEINVKELIPRIERSREFKLSGGVFWCDYVAVSINRDTVEDFIREGKALSYGSALCLLKDSTEEFENTVQVCFITGEDEDLEHLCDNVLSMNEENKIFYVPRGSRVISTLKKKGLTREGCFILFER